MKRASNVIVVMALIIPFLGCIYPEKPNEKEEKGIVVAIGNQKTAIQSTGGTINSVFRIPICPDRISKNC